MTSAVSDNQSQIFPWQAQEIFWDWSIWEREKDLSLPIVYGFLPCGSPSFEKDCFGLLFAENFSVWKEQFRQGQEKPLRRPLLPWDQPYHFQWFRKTHWFLISLPRMAREFMASTVISTVWEKISGLAVASIAAWQSLSMVTCVSCLVVAFSQAIWMA
jgi:hypothetical protein